MVHPSRSVPDGLPASPQALDQRDTALTELALGVPQVLLGLRQHQLLGKHRLLADGASAQLRLLTTEQLLVALVNLLEGVAWVCRWLMAERLSSTFCKALSTVPR
jgi:hypothetical protein